MPVYGFIYDYGRDNLLQGGKSFSSIEGTSVVQSSTDLVNEKLTFYAFHSQPRTQALTNALQVWRIRCPGSAAIGLANVLRVDWTVVWNIVPNHGIVRPAIQSVKAPEQVFTFSTNQRSLSSNSDPRWGHVHFVSVPTFFIVKFLPH